MYLDQRIREHTLLQAIARTNRTYPRKEFGLVVDYAGVGRELAEALVIFEKEDLEGLFGVGDIQKEIANLDYWHKKTISFFKRIDLYRGRSEDILQQCMEILEPEDVRADFDVSFRNMARSFDLLMPDPVVDPFLKDFKLLGIIREGAKNLYRDERLSLEECSKKVEALIHAHIVDTGMENILGPINITAPDFREKLEMKGNTKAKASHVEYAIRQTINEKISTDPAFYGSLKERLERIIEEDSKERKDEAKLLIDLMDLGKNEGKRDAYSRSLGFGNVGEFSIYGLLLPFRKSMFADSEEEQVVFTKSIIQSIKGKRVIDWTEKEDIQREMRKEIKRLLRAKGCRDEHLEPLTREILDLARIHLKDI